MDFQFPFYNLVLRERSEIIKGGGGLQILKYFKVEQLNPSLYNSIKSCNPANAGEHKLVTFSNVICNLNLYL